MLASNVAHLDKEGRSQFFEADTHLDIFCNIELLNGDFHRAQSVLRLVRDVFGQVRVKLENVGKRYHDGAFALQY